MSDRAKLSHRAPAGSNGRTQVPEACVARLSLYLREVSALHQKRMPFVSSRRLAQQLGLTDAMVRRDLSYFGQFGTSGRGYEIRRLLDRLTAILGMAGHTWNVALAGLGNLGSALLAYRGFEERGFVFKAVVDADPSKVGTDAAGLRVAPVSQLAVLAREHRIAIGLIAVPVRAAQAVCDQFVAGGVKAIVNFAPARLDVPADVRLSTVDLAVELESLAFHLARTNGG